MNLKPILRIAAGAGAVMPWLEKARRGVAELPMAKLLDVLDYIGGWQYEARGAVARLDEEESSKEIVLPEGDIEATREWHVKRNRTELGVGKIRKLPTGEMAFSFQPVQWNTSLWLKSPEGKELEAVNPHLASFQKGKDPLKGVEWKQVKSWLHKDTGFLAQVANAMGKGEVESSTGPKQRRDLNGTGTCPCCFRNIKVKAVGEKYEMALHGYKRPGWGRAEGRCMGVKYEPFELSPKGTEDLIDYLEKDRLPRMKDRLQLLEADKLDTIYHHGRAVDRSYYQWDDALAQEVKNMRLEVNLLEGDIDKLKDLLYGWKLKDLPSEGDKIAPPPGFLAL